MRKIMATIALVASTVVATAQSTSYPDAVKDLYERADAASLKGAGLPIIAVPVCVKTQELACRVAEAGGVPVIVPEYTNSQAAVSEAAAAELYRQSAAAWDGAIVPDGWVAEDNLYSALFYKAAADRNVPVLGTSELEDAVDKGLMHLKNDIKDADTLIARAKLFKRAKEVMSHIFTCDTHADLPCEYENGARLGRRGVNQVSLQKMDEGHLDGQFLICYLGGPRKNQNPTDPAKVAEADAILAALKADVEAESEYCGFARTPAEARALKAHGKKAMFFAVENGYAIGGDIANVRKLADLGVAYMTLSHTYDNAICHSSSHSADTTLGLTKFGRQVVKEMNKYGIMVDCSHTSSGTFWDCIKYSKTPVICSHSGSKKLYNHDRNITDDQMRALAAKGGVLQVCFVRDFLRKRPQWPDADVNDGMEHIFHAIDVMGVDHVGIGIDYDGGGGVNGCNGDNDSIVITMKLLEHGLSEEEIGKVWGGNLFRVMDEVKAYANKHK